MDEEYICDHRIRRRIRMSGRAHERTMRLFYAVFEAVFDDIDRRG